MVVVGEGEADRKEWRKRKEEVAGWKRMPEGGNRGGRKRREVEPCDICL